MSTAKSVLLAVTRLEGYRFELLKLSAALRETKPADMVFVE